MSESPVECAPFGVAPADRKREEPLLGGYFVSAYPPFACWTEDGAAAFDRCLDQAPSLTSHLGLYVHIPFCSERCQFCYYLSHDDRPGDLESYLRALLTELRLYAGRSRLRDRELDFVYFGGGTPSLLSTERVETLLGGMQAILPWTRVREVTFECAPSSVTTAKLEALRERGVTRISLGVQELDDDVLRRNGRVHLVADVERAIERIQQAGFPVLNVDLISGLVGQTDDSFRSSLDRVVDLAPESVTIYLLEIPHNTPLFRAVRDGDLEAPPADWREKRHRLEAGFARLEDAGYDVRSAYTAVRDPERHGFRYQDEQYRGADLVGIGASSFSYLAGVHHQNLSALPAYLSAVRENRLPLWRGYALDDEERFVRELVLQLKLGAIDCEQFVAKFGSDPLEVFGDRLEAFRGRGWLTIDGTKLILTRAGLSRVDRMLPELYLPRHRPMAEPG